MVAYRGQVPGPDSDYSGEGLFKFVLVDGKGQSAWANDGTYTEDGSEPVTAVQIRVFQGQYSVLLGDKSLPGMAGDLDARVFSDPDRWLRVWFSKDGDKFYQSEYDEPIGSVPYAMQAQVALFADSVDGLQATDLQARVFQECAVGSAIRAIHADGTVECTEAQAAQASLTSVTITSLDPGAGRSGGIAIGADGLPVIVSSNYDYSAHAGGPQVVHCGNAACSSGNTVTAVNGLPDGEQMSLSFAMGRDGLPILALSAAPPGGGNAALYALHCGVPDCTSGNVLTFLDRPTENQTDIDQSEVAIGADGLPLITYVAHQYAYRSRDMKVVHCGNPACSAGNTMTMVQDNVGMQAFSVAIGADGLPLIICMGENYPGYTGYLYGVRCRDARCSTSDRQRPIEESVDTAGGVSLAVGSDHLPVISYYDRTNGALRVLHCGNAACTGGNARFTVDNAGDVGSVSSIAIGLDGLPVIAYNEQPIGHLKVAHCGNPACSEGNTIRTLDSAPLVGSPNTIRIGSDGLPVIAYSDNSNNVMRVAHCPTASCWALGVP